MRAKEYLSQVRFLDERITCKLADAARLQDMATRITPVLREDGVSGGGGAPDRLADAVKLTGTKIVADDRLHTVCEAVDRHKNELQHRLENGHRADVEVAAVRLQSVVHDDGNGAFCCRHNKRRDAERHDRA